MELSIYPIHMGLNTVYVIKGEGVILIDAGFPHKLANFKGGLAKASIQPEEKGGTKWIQTERPQ
jgi:hypothetical protein